jgi:hypothetical protein
VPQSVLFVQVERSVRGAVLLIIRRSWVRAPPAPPAVLLEVLVEPWTGCIYRPPHEERCCTLAHLDTERQILTAAKRMVPQLVTTGLNAKHRDAVVTMLAALAESYNIAEFLGKTPGSDVPHRPVPLHEIQGRLLRVCN